MWLGIYGFFVNVQEPLQPDKSIRLPVMWFASGVARKDGESVFHEQKLQSLQSYGQFFANHGACMTGAA